MTMTESHLDNLHKVECNACTEMRMLFLRSFHNSGYMEYSKKRKILTKSFALVVSGDFEIPYLVIIISR